MNKNPFPPIRWLWRDYRRSAAWYSGDPRRLRREGGSFWQGDEDVRFHVPAAAELAALSAALIFARSPDVRCTHAPTRDRIEHIFEKAGVYPVLLQAAELASAYGGVFLKWSWNLEDGFPRLHAVPADCGLPLWRNGRMEEIRIWSLLREEDDGSCWRLEERYTPDGCIRSSLLKGTRTELGRSLPLTAIPESRGVRPLARSGAGCMLAFYVPNLLPCRRHPALPFGRSDFDGLWGLFDALDEAYSAIQREARLTKTTVIVPAEYLRRRESLFPGEGPAWHYSNRSGVFTALDIDSDRSSSPITVINPAPHAAERIALCEEILRRIYTMAGYAPQSAGLDEGGRAESGTALAIRERRSIRTAENKKTLWWQALNEIIAAMLRLDRAVFSSGADPDAPFSVELAASCQPDAAEAARLAAELSQAKLLSVEAAQQLLHPDWTEEERAQEAGRIARASQTPEPHTPAPNPQIQGKDEQA